MPTITQEHADVPSPRLSEPARIYRDGVWLRQHKSGLKIAEIAAKAGVSPRTVSLGLKRARDAAERVVTALPPPARPPWWLDLVPLFPITSFTPQSKCPHRGPIKPGSVFCCMVCSGTGRDGHPALRRDPTTDPKPEPKPGPAAKPNRRTRRRAA